MTLKRLILSVLTVVALVLVSLDLLHSWNQPQIQSRLELYQTNLLLHAAEWRGAGVEGGGLETARNTLVGEDAFETALKQYQEARESAEKSLEQARAQLQALQEEGVDLPPAPPAPSPDIRTVQTAPRSERQQLLVSINKLSDLIEELDLRLGILQAHKQQADAALKTWTDLLDRKPSRTDLVRAADVLVELWSSPPRIVPSAEPVLKRHLDGWFRYRALSRLYELQQREGALAELEVGEQAVAERAVLKLAIVGGIPTVGFVVGAGLLVFLAVQWLVKRGESLLAQNGDVGWETPWDGETIWQVLIVGFFFVGQILVPFTLQLSNALLKINPGALDVRLKAFYILASYVLLAAGGLLVLYLSVRPFWPLPEGWFRAGWRGYWFFWGAGGYFVALPLVIVVSLLNQRLWQGQGGSNPILPIALENRDSVALAVFFLTASVAAPVFEEIMFRGFLLPSLTRYLPVWGAIAASSLLFAVAHLNLSEVLPLATLGAVLGFVYTRTRNLFASMLLHSLWNSGTLLSLFVLGSGSG